jgi:hypothetical protein
MYRLRSHKRREFLGFFNIKRVNRLNDEIGIMFDRLEGFQFAIPFRFRTDKYSDVDIENIIADRNGEEKLKLFNHFLDRWLTAKIYITALKEIDVPNLPVSQTGHAFINLGKELFERIEKSNPELAQKIEEKFGKFLPFKVDVERLSHFEIGGKTYFAKISLYPKIIPYPLVKEDDGELITNPKKAEKWFHDYVEKVKEISGKGVDVVSLYLATHLIYPENKLLLKLKEHFDRENQRRIDTNNSPNRTSNRKVKRKIR